MKFTAAVATLALAAGVSAASNSTGDVYVTEVVTAYTTYCPAATSVVHNGVTYTVSEATTLTITDCPCTITRPATSSAPTAAAYMPSPVYSNGTVATTSGVAKPSGTGSGVASSSSMVPYTGAAAANTVSGAAVAALGLAAFFL